MSNFSVGASVLTIDGKIFNGCNVENVCLPCGWCAEISAIATAVSNGYKKIIGCCVSTNSLSHVAPCGRCRQVIAEFSSDYCIVYLVNKLNEVKTIKKFSELLPAAFNNEELESGQK
ncbi:unnamed protein product [Schistosoma turkestanicum]|nr:unnamed protein product [Schistosoma turkestanicum]